MSCRPSRISCRATRPVTWSWSAAEPRRARTPRPSCGSGCGRTSTTCDSAAVRTGGALDYLEGAAGNALQLIEVLVVPAAVATAAEEPVGSVVGDDHAVALERFGDHAGAAAEAAEPVARPEPQARPHRRRACARRVAGAVRGGMEPSVPGAVEGDADRVFEVARGDLVIADEAGEDRQPGGIGRGPRVRPAGARAQVPARARVGIPMPAAGLEERPVELVERAAGAVDDEHVTIAVAAFAALDRRGLRHRERSRVALVAVGGVVDRKLRLAGVDDGVGEAIGAGRAEVGM